VSGGSAGGGRRGGNSASDEQEDSTGGSWELFRYGGASRTYVWGYTLTSQLTPVTSTLLSTAAPNGPDNLRAHPQIFPRGGVIGRMGWFNPVVYGGGGGELRFGIYSDASGAPDQLLFDSGAFTSWPDPAFTNTRWRAVNVNLQVEAMSVLWAAWIYNDALRAASQRVWTISSNTAPGLLGFLDPEVLEPGDSVGAGPRIPGTASCVVGCRVPQAYGALPTTFPSLNRVSTCMNNSTLEPSTLDGNLLCLSYKFTPEAL
jgi:hypothetical protein